MRFVIKNAEKGGGVLMSIIFRNLNHSFICPVPDPFPDSGFRIPNSGFSIRPYLIYLLQNAEKDLFTSMFFETALIKSNWERPFRNSVSE